MSNVGPAEIEKMKAGGNYIACRELADGSIACVGELFSTRAIYLNCDDYGYSTRFCFENRELALIRFAELLSEDDVPDGHVARRGR